MVWHWSTALCSQGALDQEILEQGAFVSKTAIVWALPLRMHRCAHSVVNVIDMLATAKRKTLGCKLPSVANFERQKPCREGCTCKAVAASIAQVCTEPDESADEYS
jgi:hypothetical protein